MYENRMARSAQMNVLVIYHSRTGKTRAMAEEVARGIAEVEGVNCSLKPVAEVAADDFAAAAGVIAGSPVYFGTMAAELKSVFDRLVGVRKKMAGKIGAAFATSAHPSGGKETTIISILQALLIYGMIVVGDPLAASGHYGAACSGPMDETAADTARKLGRRVAELAKALYASSLEKRY
jgi:NAD(P)H dehydrogenase (quinone)